MFQRSRVSSCRVTRRGLLGSVSFHNSALWDVYGGAGQDASERAVLVQSSGNLRALREAKLPLQEPLEECLVPGCFGENLFLEGMSAESLCVGDELECWRAGARRALRPHRVVKAIDVAGVRSPARDALASRWTRS